jgi:hypothetical protein
MKGPRFEFAFRPELAAVDCYVWGDKGNGAWASSINLCGRPTRTSMNMRWIGNKAHIEFFTIRFEVKQWDEGEWFVPQGLRSTSQP